RTGVLVSGHPRLPAADPIYRTQLNEVPVAIIDVAENAEKMINVQLNNPSMQGSGDLGALADLNADGINWDDMGFNKADIEFMYDGEVDFDGDVLDDDNSSDDGDSDDEQSAVSKRDTPFDEEVEDEKDKLADMSELNDEDGLE
ncbi:nuclease, partial [Limosilactobacillus reuteri]